MKAIKNMLVVTGIFMMPVAYGQTGSTVVTTSTVINANTQPLLGITMDARCGMNGTTTPVGYFTTTGALVPNLDTIFNDFPLNGVRYPGNAVVTRFQWKKAIGSIPRPNQFILGALGPSQSMDYGFDEFMSWCESKGLQGQDVQIMVQIYDSAVTYGKPAMDSARVPNPANFAADWVEYANAPNDGSNWGGGKDWALERSLNGHDAPYGIKTWNIGNEPWAPSELNFDTSLFFPIAKPIIDSMLSRDPTIHITIPTTGSANSPWNKMIRKHQRIFHDMYGISPHFFGHLTNVDLIESTLKEQIDSSDNVAMKVIVGDFAHEILSGSSLYDKNKAMAWIGVNFTVDMLLMMSQMSTIERANFWAFGMPKAVWRPIRFQSAGNHKMLPVGRMYEVLDEYFANKSLQSVSTSPVASDGHPYSLRASVFSNSTNDSLYVVALNRDSLNSLTYSISGLSAYSLYDAKILYSDSLMGEVVREIPTSPDVSGNFTIPATGLLLLKYYDPTTSVGNNAVGNRIFKVYPNPASDIVNIEINSLLSKNAYIVKLFDGTGKLVEYFETKPGVSQYAIEMPVVPGIYLVSLSNSEIQVQSKIIKQ